MYSQCSHLIVVCWSDILSSGDFYSKLFVKLCPTVMLHKNALHHESINATLNDTSNKCLLNAVIECGILVFYVSNRGISHGLASGCVSLSETSTPHHCCVIEVKLKTNAINLYI